MQAEYSIRVATPDDANAVSRLLELSYPPLMRGAYDSGLLAAVLPLMTRANPSLLLCGTFYVAVSADGAIVGCGGWTRARPDGGAAAGNLGHIRHFATHPDWTRKGVGRAVYARCETTARADGVEEFECWASRNAKAFYVAIGFRVVAGIDVRFGSHAFPGLRMRRDV